MGPFYGATLVEAGPHPALPEDGEGEDERRPSLPTHTARLVKSGYGTIMPLSRFPHPTETAFMLTTAHILPLAALLGGILILLVPRLLNFIVAIYLILVGLMGLGLRFH